MNARHLFLIGAIWLVWVGGALVGMLLLPTNDNAAANTVPTRPATAVLAPTIIAGDTASPDGIWSDLPAAAVASITPTLTTIPERFRLLAADLTRIEKIAATAPLESEIEPATTLPTVWLPLPDGGYAEYMLIESPILPADTASQINFRSYRVIGIGDAAGSTGRISLSDAGLRGVLLFNAATVLIEPTPDGSAYLNFDQADNPGSRFSELPPLPVPGQLPIQRNRSSEPTEPIEVAASGDQLRTYRLAVAATAEYTANRGGQAAALEAVAGSVNLMNAVYERDLAVRFTLVSGANVIFTDAATDGFTSGNVNALLDENQTILDRDIGNANYDIGHVLDVAGGGVASLNSTCQSTTKAQGASGVFDPTPANMLGILAHEVGHQFGAQHTFNASDANNCNAQNRAAQAAYEPGSGSTLMAYGDICAPQNIGGNSDQYFHIYSYIQMRQHVDANPTCGMLTPITNPRTNQTNTIPTVSAGADFTMPARTQFELRGTGNDPDGDPLSYAWEQYDVGTAATGNLPNPDQGDNPIFRSYAPVNSPNRIFPNPAAPQLAALGETLPTRSRTLNFQLTVRDTVGGLNNDQMRITVVDTGRAFALTQNDTTRFWRQGQQATVTWDVANTNAPPISCANVRLLLSTDNGVTYPTVLVESAPNNGSATITVPNTPNTSTARVRVECAITPHTFFAASTNSFSIDAQCQPAIQISSTAESGAGSLRESLTNICPNGTITFAGNTTIALNSPLVINKPLTIDGGTNAVVLNGQDQVRVIDVQAGATNLILRGLTIRGGGGDTNDGNAGIRIASGAVVSLERSSVINNQGGIQNRGTLTVRESTIANNTIFSSGAGIANNGGGRDNPARLTVIASTISNNQSTVNSGGGLANAGIGDVITIVNSTISGNRAAGGGGAIGDLSSSQIDVYHSTIANNTADGNAAGIYAFGGTYRFSHTILSNPPQNIGSEGTFATFTSLGYNLLSDANPNFNATGDIQNGNAALGALGDNGGFTQTHLPGAGSGAIGAGNAATCRAAPANGADQRNLPRGSNACDIGAVEVNPPVNATVTPTTSPTSGTGAAPTATPTLAPGQPTATPTTVPTATPTLAPGQPTATPTAVPVLPTATPTTPPAPAPSLSAFGDEDTGAPGSTFAFEGTNFTPNVALNVTVNGVSIGTTTADEFGVVLFTVQTLANAQEGRYVVAVSVGTALQQQSQRASSSYTLNRNASTLSLGDGFPAPISVPESITPNEVRRVYLPLVTRQ